VSSAQNKRILLALGVALALGAGATAAAERTHDIQPEDYFTLHYIYNCATSPDGKYVAFTDLTWADRDQPRHFDLWVVSTETRRLERLTFETVNEHQPQWAADSQHLYFLTKRDRGEKRPPYDGSQQVWVMTTQRGEPLPVTRVKGGVLAYQVSKDGRTLYYTKDGEQAEDEWKDLRRKYPGIEFGSGPVTYTELWKLDLESWREEKLVAEKRVIVEFKVSDDQRRIAMITTPDNRLLTKEGQSRVDVYDAATKQIITLPDQLYRAQAPSPYGWLENLAWSPDGNRLAFVVNFDGYPAEILVAEWSGEQPQVFMLKRPGEVSVVGGLQWVPGESGLAFLGQYRARQRVYYIGDVRQQKPEGEGILTPGDVVVHDYSFSADGKRLAFLKSTTQHIADVFMTTPERAKGEAIRLTNFNPQVDTWKLPQISLVTWTAPDGVEVEGILELPPDYTPERGPLPMIVELHGGPSDATLHYMQFWIYGRILLPAKGYALLSPNYRGSTGYGDEFMTALVGREADIEVQDVLSGVDAMIERGIADPNRLGLIGWSNGGFLVNVLITLTPRFKAASTGAGVVDQVMQWGLEDTPGHVINYMRGLPWERTEAYVDASAIYRLGEVVTPTLIHVGEKDDRVPAAHCRTLYRGLKEYVGVPTVLLVYPGAGHGLTVYDHRLAKMEWDLAWFDRYLLGKSEGQPRQP